MILITVDKNSPINTIQSALNLILDENDEPVTIYIKNGVYKEKLRINHPNITFIGEDKNNTIITYDDYAKKIHEDGKEYNTFRTYTVIVLKENIIFKNITIKNEAGSGENIGQAVALSVYADKFSMFNCILSAHQDTLFNGPLPDDLIARYEGFLKDDERIYQGISRQYFEHCTIEGDVDFIFGCGTCIFDNCVITSLGRDSEIEGYVCAPAHPITTKYGHTFISCEFNNKGCKDESVYLARPWRDYGKATFINCLIGKHIKKEAFDKWNDTNRDKTCRFEEYESITEFKDERVKWAKKLTSIDLVDYKMETIFGDWNPIEEKNIVKEELKNSN
jgi:pectinesterase